jgi:uncharacterized small protein (DUF1192 family)
MKTKQILRHKFRQLQLSNRGLRMTVRDLQEQIATLTSAITRSEAQREQLGDQLARLISAIHENMLGPSPAPAPAAEPSGGDDGQG